MKNSNSNRVLSTVNSLILLGITAVFGILYVAEKAEYSAYKNHVQDQSEYFKNEHSSFMHDLNKSVMSISDESTFEKTSNDYDFPHESAKQIEQINQHFLKIDQSIKEKDIQNGKLLLSIESLERELQKKRYSIGSYLEEIQLAQVQIENLQDKNQELKTEVQQLHVENENIQFDLEAKNAEIEWYYQFFKDTEKLTLEQQKTINDLKEEIATAFFIVDEHAKLKQSGIVDGQHPLTLWSNYQVKNGIQKDDLHKINKFTYRTIPVFSKKAKLITKHHPDSYQWVTSKVGVEYLYITNPSLFWQGSNFLVISTKDPIQEQSNEIGLNK